MGTRLQVAPDAFTLRPAALAKALGSQNTGSDPIIMYPDVKRNLMIMRGMTAAARTICYATAVAIDVSHRATDPKVREKAAARGALLTPMAKALAKL